MHGQFLKNMLLYWAVSPGLRDLINRGIQAIKTDEKRIVRLCEPNISYKNIHQGQRCFIVCSGPSVKKQNLLSLKNEITFFVSSGFLHPDYSFIQPNYHCAVDILLTPKLTREKYAEWFQQMDSKIGTAQLFLSAADESFIIQNDLFRSRRLNYVHMGLKWDSARKEIYDISQKIPTVQSVPIMAIMIAMYMGCGPIYLLGVELDEIWRGEFKHFYPNEIMRNDLAVNEDGKSTTPLIEMFKINYTLWQQFDILRSIAEENNIKIFNATQGGALDIYRRAKFENLFDE
jgi:hypothetical protein